jgi:hypothetical protein
MAADIISSLTQGHAHHLSHHQRSLLNQTCAALESQVKNGSFTAWSVGVDGLCLSGFYADECSQECGPHPIFDLSSLTKPLLGGLLFLQAFGENWVRHLLDTPPNGPHPQIPAELAEKIRISQLSYLDLFSHQSGLPPWRWFGRGLFHSESGKRLATITGDGHCGLTADRMAAFVQRLISAMLPQYAIGSVHYSDCGYFLLSRLFEADHRILPGGCWRMALQSLNASLGSNFFHASLTPSKPRHAAPYFPYLISEREYIGAALSIGRQFGSVHDTNANILACLNPEDPLVSIHAGLFGSVTDVCAATRHLNHSWATQEPALTHLRKGNDRFCAFLDTATGSSPLSAAPPEFRQHVFGHLGFTGTSFWFRTQPTLNSCVLLTNRTARRTLVRAEEAPRIFSLTTPDQAVLQHAVLTNGQSQAISVEDCAEMRESHYAAVERYWNDSDCRPAADIAAVRRQAGANLWQICR